MGAFSAGKALALACVIAAAAPAAAACSPPPRCPTGGSCPGPPVPRLAYVTTVNGRSGGYAGRGTQPRFGVRPGERLRMTVTVTVPGHLRLSALWLGISAGSWGCCAGGRPSGLRPILLHSGRPLAAGTHSFTLRWRVPAGTPGRRLYLVSAWSARRPSASVEGAIAVLPVR